MKKITIRNACKLLKSPKGKLCLTSWRRHGLPLISLRNPYKSLKSPASVGQTPWGRPCLPRRGQRVNLFPLKNSYKSLKLLVKSPPPPPPPPPRTAS